MAKRAVWIALHYILSLNYIKDTSGISLTTSLTKWGQVGCLLSKYKNYSGNLIFYLDLKPKSKNKLKNKHPKMHTGVLDLNIISNDSILLIISICTTFALPATNRVSNEAKFFQKVKF